MIYPYAEFTTLMTFTPTTIAVLLVNEEFTSFILCVGILVRFTHASETFHSKHPGISKTNSPTSIPTSVFPLIPMNPFPRLDHRPINITPSIPWIFISESYQCSDYGSGTLRITILDHNPTKDFSGIDPFHPGPSAGEFVGGEPARGVLQGEKYVNRVL